MRIYIDVDNKSRIQGWGSSSISENSIEIDIPDNHPMILGNTNHMAYSYIDKEVVFDLSNIMDTVKEEKEEELNELCNQAILEGFSHTVRGIEYHFPFGIETQLNFESSRKLLEEGFVQDIKWTVRDSNDDWIRLSILKEDLSSLSLAIHNHKEENISKYRDVLLPKLELAQDLEDINSIQW